MEDNFELQVSKLPQPLPTPTPEIKKVSKKSKPCTNCPDSINDENLREKVLALKDKGFDDNRIAAMLMIRKERIIQVQQ